MRSASDRDGPGAGAGRSRMARRGDLTLPAARRRSRGDAGIAVSCATGRPRSVIVTVSPAAALATTADAFCFKARMPTSDMCYIVAHASVVVADRVPTRAILHVAIESPPAVSVWWTGDSTRHTCQFAR